MGGATPRSPKGSGEWVAGPDPSGPAGVTAFIQYRWHTTAWPSIAGTLPPGLVIRNRCDAPKSCHPRVRLTLDPPVRMADQMAPLPLDIVDGQRPQRQAVLGPGDRRGHPDREDGGVSSTGTGSRRKGPVRAYFVGLLEAVGLPICPF